MRCSNCGHASGNGVTGSLTSWLFHEQLCSCKDNPCAEPMLLGSASSFSAAVKRNLSEDVIDLGERYEIMGVIGNGGMGTVYKARDKTDGNIVAIKVLKAGLVSNLNVSKRFEQEALAVSRLNHPNLIAVKGSGKSPSGAPYIVMEYFAGGSLADLIKERGPRSPKTTVKIAISIAEALEHAHAFGVIHRDIKPSNILVSQEDGQSIVKVVDFGIAKAATDTPAESTQLTQTGEIFGSPAYMSPEQCLGESVDERSDIYSLGCVMYEMLSGKSPFASDNPIQSVLKHINQEPESFEIEFARLRIPKPLEALVFKCLSKSPFKRYDSVSTLKQELLRLGYHPASTGIRFVAAITDLFVFCSCFYIFCMTLQLYSDQFCSSLSHAIYSMFNPTTALFCLLVDCILYIACCESGPRQATLGMRIWGLHVVNLQGQRINWLNSAIRSLTLIAVLLALWHSNQLIRATMIILGAWHIHMARPEDTGLEVIMLISSCVAYWLLIAFSKKHLSPIDRMFNRIVAHSNELSFKQTSSLPPTEIQWTPGFVAIGCIVLLPWFTSRLNNLAAETPRPVVFAVKEITSGKTISADAVEVRMVPHSDAGEALSALSEVVSKVAYVSCNCGNGHGQLEPGVMLYDFELKP